MTQTEEEEQPLDPVLEKVRRKMMRLLIVSISIMMVGLFAVLIAIIYKVGNSDDAESVANSTSSSPETELVLPEGDKVLSTSSNGNHLIVTTGQNGTVNEIVVMDVNTGKIIRRVQARH